jgi:hypothetical protein
MFVSVAIKLTPEAEEKLLKLEETGAFGEGKENLFRQLLQSHRLSNTPNAEEIARQTDLAVRTVRQIDRAERGPANQISHQKTYDSVFLSYGGPDEPFARKLFLALRGRGVEVFFFPESATPGQRLHRTMSESIHEYDRMLLICSRSSLIRPGVLNELEQVLSREAREAGAELLMPVIIDDFVLTEWAPSRPDLGRQVRDRVAADFRKATDDAEFAKQMDRVLNALATSKCISGRPFRVA